MLRQEVDEEDLRTEIYSLRKHITRVCSENQILKVKIRKLQDEMIRRDRQLDEFLQSKRFFGLPKNLQDKGASLLMNLKLKNDKQEQLLLEKDMTIKRLQNALQTAKLYNSNCLNKKFASKGIECILLGDNKCEYYKKGKMNNKLELHMPTFDMGDFDANGKNYKSEKNVFAINRNDTNSAESQFLLDINLDLKQSTKPLFSSESRYERRRSAYHMEAKSSKSEGLLEMTSTEYIPIGGRRSNIDEYKKGEAHFEFQESVEPNGCTNPVFKKILRTIEELMAQGKYSDTNYAKTIDESVQFPCDGPEMVRIIDSNCNNVTHETIILTTIKSNNKNFDMEANILNNEQPPCILNETQVQELSDPEEISISEKIDTMEKSEIEVEEKISTMDKEMPHEEIKQLHVFLLDMISQVDSLKDTISQMKADQEKTENDLRTKNESIEKLAKKIEELRELRSISTVDIEKLGNQLKTSVEIPEKESVTAESYDVMQKTTQQNIKKIAGKIKHLRETKSKSSISSQTQKKTTRSSSKCSKSEKKKCSEKNIRKSEKKGQEIAINSQKVFGIGSGDVIEVPFYRCGFLTTSEMNRSTTKNEFDELD